MDATDLSILTELQRDGRLSNQELADRVGLSPSPCLRRLRRLEESGVIAGYGVRLDRRLFGLPVTVFVRLRLGQHDQTNIAMVEEGLIAIEEVVECYLVAGEADYLLKLCVSSLDHYEEILRNSIRGIPFVTAIETNFVMSVINESGELPTPRTHRAAR